MSKPSLLFTLIAALLLAIMPAAAQDAFPVTVEHKFGSTTITEAPQRVVAIGFTDQDPLLALGVKPVAVRYWYGDESNAIFPWAQDEADGAQPVVLNMLTPNFEAILELDPDMIISVYSGITEEEYDLLSEIAPTIAQPGEYFDYGVPWDVATRMIGAAVGKAAEAETAVSDVEALFAATREQNPEFAGKTIAVAYNFGTTYGFFPSQDPRGRFFENLGFVIPDELNEFAGENYYADISAERLDLLDQDLLVFVGMEYIEGGPEAIETDPLMSQLDAVKEGRVLYIPLALDDALQFSTVLSLPYLVESIVPEIHAVLGGETVETAQTECADGFRVFVDARGEVCVPEKPLRIVATHDYNAGVQVLSLGGPLVGMASRSGEFAPDITRFFDLSEMPDIGEYYSPSVERVLELQPDLIVHEGFNGTLYYEGDGTLAALEAIAPVVAIDSFRPIEEVMADYQELLGESATITLDDQQAEFAAVLDEIRAVLGDDWSHVTASVLQGGEGGLTAWGPSALVPNDILTRVGVSWVAPQIEAGLPENGGALGGFSLEQIELFSGDLILVDTILGTELFDNPLVQRLPAIQAGQFIQMNERAAGNHYLNYIAVAKYLLAGLQAIENFDTNIVAEPEAQVSADSCEAGFRLFDHELLTTDPVCIPENPQRIVAADSYVLENMLALDAKPVGSAVVGSFLIEYPDLSSLVEGIADIGNPVNLESVLNTQPDLIMAIEPWIGEQYEEFSQIAPTLSIRFDGVTSKEFLSIIGEVLNTPANAEEAISVLSEREETLAQQISEKGLGGTVSIALFYADVLYVYDLDISFPTMARVGLTALPAQTEAIGGEWRIELSKEQLPLIDTDYVFLVTFASNAEEDAANAEMVARLEADPLWQSLNVVQNGHVYLVGSQWITGTIAGEHKVLDDLFTYIAGVDPAEVSPNPFLTKANFLGEGASE